MITENGITRPSNLADLSGDELHNITQRYIQIFGPEEEQGLNIDDKYEAYIKKKDLYEYRKEIIFDFLGMGDKCDPSLMNDFFIAMDLFYEPEDPPKGQQELDAGWENVSPDLNFYG